MADKEIDRKVRNQLLFHHQLRDIGPVDSGEQCCPPGHSMGPAIRTYWLFHYVLSGKGFFEREGMRYKVREGQCFVIKPYETSYYEADKEDPWHYVWCGFTCEIELPRVLAESPVIAGQKVTEIFHRLLTLYRKQIAYPEIPIAAAIWEMIASFCVTEPAIVPKSSEQYVALGKSYMEREYMRGITVHEIAELLHLDRSYFSTIFRRHMGLSPQQYLMDYRLQAAAELLRQKFPVSLVATSTGYSDVSNFSKMFKKKFGVSPNRFGEEKRGEGNAFEKG